MNELLRNKLKRIFSVIKEFLLYTILIFALWCMAELYSSSEYIVELLSFFIAYVISWRFMSFLTSILHESYSRWLILGVAWYIDFLLICLSKGLSLSDFVDMIMH